MKMCTVLLASTLMLCSSLAQAFSLPQSQNRAAVNESYDFEGIVSLSNCSGSLVRFDDSSDQDYALVLTNGHCVSMMRPDTVFWNRNSARRFGILGSDASTLGYVRARRLLYATMSKTDMALYQLRRTYDSIRSEFEIEAIQLDRTPPRAGEAIEILSGFWKRGYRCLVDRIVFSLIEGRWTFKDSIRYSRPGCEVVGGTSGSPIIASSSRTVIGVNNTGNESGKQCTLNNPCEVDEDGNIFFEKGLAYGQQTYWLYSCRDTTGALDLMIEGCHLPSP